MAASGRVGVGFFEKGIEIRVAVRIEQAQAGEVAGGSELLGRGGEQQQRRDFRGERLDHGIVRGGLAGRPFEVVGFIHDEQIETRRLRLRGCAPDWSVRKSGGGEDELGIKERIGFRVMGFDGLAALLVEDGEEQVEAAEKLDEPLVDERLGDEDEDAVGAAGEMKAVKDEAGLDGFPESDFIGEQDARMEASGGFRDDGELVRDEIDAGTRQSRGRAIGGCGCSNRGPARRWSKSRG